MSNQDIDFIKGHVQRAEDKKEQGLSLYYAYPTMNKVEDDSVLSKSNTHPRELYQEAALVEDGLYASNNPFVFGDLKVDQFKNMKILEYESKHEFYGKLVEIVVREVNINTDQSNIIKIISVYLLYKKKVICKTNSPFNRKLHKLLIRNSECNNLSIQVHSKTGQSTILPLPLPKRNIENSKVEIDFAIGDNVGRIYAGTVICTISISNYGSNERESYSQHLYKLSNDPNDPQNYLSLLRPSRNIHKKDVKYFVLEDPALTFNVDPADTVFKKSAEAEETKSPDIVIKEESEFSFFNISFANLFQINRLLVPSFGIRRHTMGTTILTVTVLRAIEVPIREESALVQPFLEVEWGNTVHATSTAEGPAPVWQQTMQFELPRQSDEHCIKFRLYDQHPVWGQQWLGEARISLENYRNCQDLERWILLSPLFSPALLFGYTQASPGQSYTRICVLIRMEQPGASISIDSNTIQTLLKGIQRCLVTPYKIKDLENPKDTARLVMLLPSLPKHYGPITPCQVLNIRKVDHYSRAALLAALLRGFNLETHVLLGSSQINKWTAFVLSIDENKVHMLWDPEIGNCSRLDDSPCPLMKVSRLITHSGIWENLQKSILPHNLKYDMGLNKDWRPIGSSTLIKSNQDVHVLELSITDEEVKQMKKRAMGMEQDLKDKLSDWRSVLGLTTVFNRHATTILRTFISKIEPSSEPQLDKRNLKQLYRAYHVHGFILNKRECPTDELIEQLHATKIHEITGPMEFALICYIQPYVGKISSVWLAVVILRSRD